MIWFLFKIQKKFLKTKSDIELDFSPFIEFETP